MLKSVGVGGWGDLKCEEQVQEKLHWEGDVSERTQESRELEENKGGKVLNVGGSWYEHPGFTPVMRKALVGFQLGTGAYSLYFDPFTMAE